MTVMAPNVWLYKGGNANRVAIDTSAGYMTMRAITYRYMSGGVVAP